MMIISRQYEYLHSLISKNLFSQNAFSLLRVTLLFTPNVHRYSLLRFFLKVIFFFSMTHSVFAIDTFHRCNKGWVARLDSLVGDMELKRAEDSQWKPANIGVCLYHDDLVKITNGQAAFYLYNHTVMKTRPSPYQEHTNEVTRLKFVKDETPLLVKLWEGFLYFMTRTPQQFSVNTPYFNAFVDGTEFVVQVSGSEHQTALREEGMHKSKGKDLVGVIEGDVRVSPRHLAALPDINQPQPQGVYSLKPGEAISISEHYRVEHFQLRQKLDEIQWLFYYPDVYVPDENKDPEGFQAVKHQRLSQSKVKELINAVESSMNKDSGEKVDEALWVKAIGMALATGNLVQAQAILYTAEPLAKKHSETFLAYQALIAMVKGDDDEAWYWLSKSGVPDAFGGKLANPHHSNQNNTVHLDQWDHSDNLTAEYWLILSYWEQTQHRISSALEAAKKALQQQPSHFLAFVRAAELSLMSSQYAESHRYLNQAEAIAPNHYRIKTVKGLLALEMRDISVATEAFNLVRIKAPSDPMGYFGLGVLDLYENRIRLGREKLELAVALAPGYELFRLYLSQAYALEKKKQHSVTQLKIATELSPNDVMVDYFLSLYYANQQRPDKALDILSASEQKVNFREIYRLPLALRGDKAAVNAFQSSLYEKVGLEEVSQRLAQKAKKLDPMDSETHRIQALHLADDELRETVYSSEVLQSQVFSDSKDTPINPIISENDLIMVESVSPVDSGYLEYSPILNEQRQGLSATLGVGTQDSTFHDLFYYGVRNQWRYAFSLYGYDTEGFRLNDGADYSLKSSFLEYSPAANLALQFQWIDREDTKADVSLTDDERSENNKQEIDLSTQDFRLSLRYLWNDHWRFVTTVRYGDRNFALFDDGPVADIFINEEKTIREQQFQLAYEGLQFFGVVGAKHATIDEQNEQVFIGAFPIPVITESEGETTYQSWYWNIESIGQGIGQDAWQYALGLSQDRLTDIRVDDVKETLNPKMGLQYSSDWGSLTWVGFRHLQTPIEATQTLAPVQILGLVTQFDDADGSQSQGVLGQYQLNLFSNPLNPSMLLTMLWGERDVRTDLDNGQASFEHRLSEVSLESRWQGWFSKWAVEYDRYSAKPSPNLGVNIPRVLERYQLPVTLTSYWGQYWASSLTMTYFYQKNQYVDDTQSIQEFNQLDTSISRVIIPEVFDVSLSGYNLLNSDNDELRDGFFNASTRMDRFVSERSLWLKLHLNLP